MTLDSRIFRPGTKYDKQHRHAPNAYHLPLSKDGYFNIKSAKDAKIRRDLYNPFFSKAAVERLRYLQLEKVEKFSAILSSAACTGEPVDLTLGYMCLTAELIANYCFGKPLGALDAPGFRYPLMFAIDQFLEQFLLTNYFWRVFVPMIKLVDMLPLSLQGPVAPITMLKSWCREQIEQVKAEKQQNKSKSKPTVLDIALDPDNSKRPDSTTEQLTDETLGVFVAGVRFVSGL